MRRRSPPSDLRVARHPRRPCAQPNHPRSSSLRPSPAAYAAAVVARRARAGLAAGAIGPALAGRRRRAIRQRPGLAAGRKAADVAALLLVARRRTGRRRRAPRAGAPGARVGAAAVDGRGLRTRRRRRRRRPRRRGGGDSVADCCGRSTRRSPTRWPRSAPGRVALAAAVGATAAMRWHWPAAYALALAFAVVLLRGDVLALVRELRAWWAPRPGPFALGRLAAVVAVGAVIALQIAVAARPEVGTDALGMHLELAIEMAREHRFRFDVTRHAWAVMPMGADWLYAAAYQFAGEAGPSSPISARCCCCWRGSSASARRTVNPRPRPQSSPPRSSPRPRSPSPRRARCSSRTTGRRCCSAATLAGERAARDRSVGLGGGLPVAGRRRHAGARSSRCSGSRRCCWSSRWRCGAGGARSRVVIWPGSPWRCWSSRGPSSMRGGEPGTRCSRS